MLSVIATPSDRPCRRQSPGYGDPVEVAYRRHLSDMAAPPILLAALLLAFAAVEHFRGSSVPPVDGIVLAVFGPLLVVLSLLWQSSFGTEPVSVSARRRLRFTT